MPCREFEFFLVMEFNLDHRQIANSEDGGISLMAYWSEQSFMQIATEMVRAGEVNGEYRYQLIELFVPRNDPFHFDIRRFSWGAYRYTRTTDLPARELEGAQDRIVSFESGTKSVDSYSDDHHIGGGRPD